MWRPLLFLAAIAVLAGCQTETAPYVSPPSLMPPVVSSEAPPPIPGPRLTPRSGPVEKLPRPANPLPPGGMVRGRVIIDPGHGGKDPGTHAASGMIEKNLVLAVGRAAAERLRARGVDVHMTRSDDRFIELDDRAYSATQYRANVFVSIHADWNPSSGKRGHTVLLPQSYSPAASALGYAVSRSLVAAGWPSYGVRHDTRGLAVLRKTACPAVLVELGFLSNSADAAQLSSPAVQERLGQAIADGIADYLRGR